MAVQYNSKDNTWSGIVVDIKNAITNSKKQLSTESLDLFSSFNNDGKEFVKVRDKILDRKKFDEWCDSVKIASSTEKDFLKTWDGSGDIAEAYQAHLKNSAESTTLFSRVTKTAGSALKKLGATLGSMAAVWAIGEAIGLAITGIDNYIHRVDNAKESLDEFNSSVQEQQDSLKSQKDWIDQNGDRYSTLAKGVDEYGHNVSLTKDEFVEYNKITSEIADMFPDMVKGYNDQNNALIKNKGNVDALTEAYKKNQDAYYADIRKDAGETFSDFKTGTQKSQKDYNDLGDFINGKKNGHDNITVVTGAHNSLLLKNSLGEENYKKIVSETAKMIKNGGGFQFDQLSEELQLAFRAAFSKVRDTIETESEKVRPILTAYLYGNASGYDDLLQDAQDAVQSFVQNVDSSFFEKFDTETDMESWIKTNVINPLKDGVDNEDLAVRIKTLFSLDEKDFKTHKEYVDAVMDIIDTLSKVVDKDGKKVYSKQQIEDFKQQLGVSDVDDEGNVVNQKKVDYLKKTYTGKIDKNKNKQAIEDAKRTIKEENQALEKEYQKISDWGLDEYADQIKNGTLPSQYGNVDMDNRQVIDWNIENVEKWKDALQSIEYYDKDGNFIDTYYDRLKKSAENGDTSIDTVFGDMIDNIKGYGDITALAFSHVVNNDDGTFEFLGKKTAEEYLYGILDVAKQDGDMSIDHILELDKKGIKNVEVYDAQGKVIGQTYVHGIISGFNDDASDISKLTHFSGKYGAPQIAQTSKNKAKKKADKAKKIANADYDIQNWYDQLSSADYKLATSSEFETALKQRKEALNGAALSADDYAKALDNVKSKEQDTTSNNKLISFEEAWNNLKSVGDDAKDVTPELLDLAKSGELSDKTLKTTSEYKTLLTETGLSAKEVRARIGEMLSEQEKMSGFKTQLQSIASAYNEFKDKKFVTAETLEGLPDVFKEINNGKSFDIFSKIVGDPKSGKKKIKEAFNDLVTEYANSQLLYQKVTSKNRDSVVANLKDAGVTNADKVVDDYIEKTKKAKKYYKLLDKADDEFTNQSEENRQADLTNLQTVLSKKNYSYKDLAAVVGENNAKLMMTLGKQYQTDYVNWLDLLDKKAEAQEKFDAAFSTDNSDVGAMGAQSPQAAAEMKDAQNNKKQADQKEKKQRKKLKKYLNKAKGLKLSFDDLEYSPKSTNNGSKNGKDSSTSSSKQTIDWIERALNRVSSTLDLIKAKAENLFGKTSLKTLQKQEASLKSQYNILKKQYSYQEKAEKKYLAKANSVKLSSSLKKAVREGRISGSLKTLIATYGEKTATKIQNYQDYWDKAQDQKKSKEETKQAMRQNKSDRYQLHIDDADARKSRNEAELENLTTAKAKESVLKNTLTHIRTSYDYQIKQAKLENDDVKVAELKAQKKKELRETEIQILQNYADEYEASVSLLETQSSSTTDLGKKNSLIQQSLTPLKNQYAKLIAIAKKEGDITEQKRLQAEYQDKLNEKLKTQFDNVADAYEFLQSGYQQKTDSLNNRISLSEAQGHYVGQDFYYNVMSSQQTVQTNLKKERDNLISKRADQIKQGLSLDSNEYREMTQKIWELDRSIEQGETDIANTAKQIREAKYAIDEFTQSRIDERNNEAEFYKTIMEYKDAFDDNGIITSEGLGILTADVFEIQNYTAKVQEYKDSLADLQKEYNAGNMGYDEFITKNQELTESMRDAQSQVYSMRDAIKSLIEEGLNAQLSALNELIDKYKETLSAEKDLRDYNKTVEEQTKNISTLQKQISALSGDTSEEGRARVQKLQVSLEDAKQQLEDTEYDKRISDIENILDDLSEDYQDFLDDQMDHIDDLVENIITAITVNSGISGEKIKELSELFGITLSDSLLNFIDKSNNTTDSDANSEADKKTQEDRNDAAQAVKEFEQQQQTEQKSVDAASKQAKADAAKKTQTESKKQTTNNTKKTMIGTAASCVKDGKISIGESGTLEKGATYYNYALSGGIKKGDKGHTTKSAHSVTIAAIDNNGNIKLKSKNKNLNGAWIPKSKMKFLQGFSTGGRVGDLQKVVKMNGDDGVTINTLKKGEEVLTPYNADLFDKFVNFLPDLVDYNNNLVDIIKPMNTPPTTKVQTGDLTLNIDNIELPNVTDPKEFSQGLISAMKQDKKLQRFWGDATVGSLNNNMSNIYKY